MQLDARTVRLGVLAASLLIFPSCGDDDPAGPRVAQDYLIHASHFVNTQTTTIRVSRLYANDPSAATAVVLIDGQTVQGSANNTADEATFVSQVSDTLGHIYAYSVTIDGVSAAGSLATPDLQCTLAITQPPPGNLIFSPDTDLDLQWSYTGSDPGNLEILGTTYTFPPVVVSQTLPPSARATTVETSQWAIANQILVQITARLRTDLSGDLAAPNSSSMVEFASAQVQLARR